MVAAADGHVSALSREFGGDVCAIAERLGIEGEGLHETAWGRSQQMFWTVCDPHQWPGPLSAGVIAGAWLHGALCGAAAHAQTNGTPPPRSATAADLLEAVRSYGAQCEETGDSTAALARYGLRRDRDQPAFAKLPPDEAVQAVSRETRMPAATASDLLGLIALDGMAVARTLLGRLARDPASPGERTERDLASARQTADLLDLADEIAGQVTAGIGETGGPDPGRLEQEPADQPIGMLPVLAKLIDEELAAARELYATLSEARSKPHVLDDHTVQRVQRMYGEKLEFLPDYERQLSRWRALVLIPAQQAEVDRLAGELVPLRGMIEMTLELAAELEHGTIDAIMRTTISSSGSRPCSGSDPGHSPAPRARAAVCPDRRRLPRATRRRLRRVATPRAGLVA
jgi:hypothetical protein